MNYCLKQFTKLMVKNCINNIIFLHNISHAIPNQDNYILYTVHFQLQILQIIVTQTI